MRSQTHSKLRFCTFKCYMQRFCFVFGALECILYFQFCFFSQNSKLSDLFEKVKQSIRNCCDERPTCFLYKWNKEFGRKTIFKIQNDLMGMKPEVTFVQITVTWMVTLKGIIVETSRLQSLALLNFCFATERIAFYLFIVDVLLLLGAILAIEASQDFIPNRVFWKTQSSFCEVQRLLKVSITVGRYKPCAPHLEPRHFPFL